MTDPRQLWELFNEILDAGEDERPALLAGHCDGNPELQADLERLMMMHSIPFPQLDDPTHLKTAAAVRDVGAPLPPVQDETHIGPYQILEEIGSGGMGVVYLAEQETPIRRQVALKVIRQGMDSREVVARFEAERQAMALMNHPSIARIFDAGVTERGSPFFAMEYVPGVPIRDYCNRERMSVDDRLELFLSVCDAVQHAHQKGVIHRDIKPSNVLVATVDGKPLAKVIDFGVAKAVTKPLGEQSIHTLEGMMIGTPEYMSPEQASGSDAIDTRSDVYALGVLLYEMLSGSLPFSSEELRREGFAELQHLIREVTPPRPSTRAGAQAARRIAGDLDWIVMKSIEKAPDQRYATPAAFAEDIRRHLRHEPITAGAPTLFQLTRKLILRNRATSIAVGTVLAALLVGIATNQGDATIALIVVLPILISGLAFSMAALRRAQRSQEGESTQRALAQKQREIADEQRIEAQRAERVAGDRLAEVLRLSDRHRLGELERQQEQLWPARPERIPALEEWLAQARTLLGRIEEHEASLDELRQNATSSDAEADQWSFAQAEEQWRHDLLAELVEGLRAFAAETGSVASVESRLQTAQTIEHETVTSPDAATAWREAIESIASLPVYDGLQVEPLVGLLPLGVNPVSGLWEFWVVETGARPEMRSDESGSWIISEETAMVLILVPGVTFTMGAQTEDPNAAHYDKDADPEFESPLVDVTLDPFFIGRHLMTQGQWLRLAGSNPARYGPGREYGGKVNDLRHPVESVSWEECSTLLTRVDLVLPTEAQWECSARAGSTTPWWTGPEPESLAGCVNLADQFARKNGAPSTWLCEDWLDDGFVTHAPVDSFRANPFGLHDVHGNVFEWCLDPNDETKVNQRRPGDGCIVTDTIRSRMHRGGSFMHGARDARSSNRLVSNPTYRGSSIGLRAARPIRLQLH